MKFPEKFPVCRESSAETGALGTAPASQALFSPKLWSVRDEKSLRKMSLFASRRDSNASRLAPAIPIDAESLCLFLGKFPFCKVKNWRLRELLWVVGLANQRFNYRWPKADVERTELNDCP